MGSSYSPNNNAGWGQWEQQGEIVGNNELNVVNNLADAAVAEADANGLLHHPEQPQDVISDNSEIGSFFRAQDSPITMELPLPSTANLNVKVLQVNNHTVSFDNDYRIRELANMLGLH